MTQSIEIQADSYRYVNWILFILAAIINSIPTQAFSGVSPLIKDIYQISQFQANAAGLFYPACYIFVIIPVNYIIDKKGLKIGTIICNTCMILGLLIRLLINVNFYMLYLGTFVCALGFCFMISGANKFANIWFPHNQIFLVSTVCIFGLFTSDAIGTFLSTFFIRQSSTKDDVFQFFLWQGIVLGIIHILMIIFFRGKPKHLQNYASAAQRNSFKQDLKALFGNKNYKIIFLCMTFIFGNVSLIFVFLPWIVKVYGFQNTFNGFIMVAANVSGCVGCVLVGLYGKNMSYKKKSLFLCVGSLTSLVVIWISLQTQISFIGYIGGAFTGLTMYPLLSTLTDFATQTTFPVGQATASGILLFGGQLSGVILTIAFSFIFDEQSLTQTRILNIILFLIFLSGIITIFFSKQILKREQYQNQKQRQSLLDQQNSILD